MARPRKPTALHIIDGTVRARLNRRKQELSLPPSSVGPAPDFVQKNVEAKKEWARLTKDPDYSAVLSSVHRGVLIEYVTLHSRMITDARGGPELGTTDRRILSSLRMQLGLTPASQSKVQGAKTDRAKPGNKWADRHRNRPE